MEAPIVDKRRSIPHTGHSPARIANRLDQTVHRHRRQTCCYLRYRRPDRRHPESHRPKTSSHSPRLRVARLFLLTFGRWIFGLPLRSENSSQLSTASANMADSSAFAEITFCFAAEVPY